MKKLILLLIILFAFYKYIFYIPSSGFVSNKQHSESRVTTNEVNQNIYVPKSSIEKAYQNRLNDIQVQDTGTVIKMLRDDLKGSRHQKFILRLSSGQTLLVAHNIDLAPRINRIKRGDNIEFYGEYEWNSKGGVIHWTHHDPKGRHAAGWLKHNGRTYQ